MLITTLSSTTLPTFLPNLPPHWPPAHLTERENQIFGTKYLGQTQSKKIQKPWPWYCGCECDSPAPFLSPSEHLGLHLVGTEMIKFTKLITILKILTDSWEFNAGEDCGWRLDPFGLDPLTIGISNRNDVWCQCFGEKETQPHVQWYYEIKGVKF